MPFLGIGIHILIAIFFAIHAIRTNQNMYWLLILFMFPGLGSIVYFFAIFSREPALARGATKIQNAAIKIIDPTKELRAAKENYEFTPTAQNQMRYASALLETGDAHAAANLYEDCLKGPFAEDIDIQFNASRAFFASSSFDAAIEHLGEIQQKDPNYRAEQVALLRARSLAQAGKLDEAKSAFAAAYQRFGSFESLAEYTIFAFENNDNESAAKLYEEIETSMSRWNRHTKEINAPIAKRLQAAIAVRKSAS